MQSFCHQATQMASEALVSDHVWQEMHIVQQCVHPPETQVAKHTIPNIQAKRLSQAIASNNSPFSSNS